MCACLHALVDCLCDLYGLWSVVAIMCTQQHQVGRHGDKIWIQQQMEVGRKLSKVTVHSQIWSCKGQHVIVIRGRFGARAGHGAGP